MYMKCPFEIHKRKKSFLLPSLINFTKCKKISGNKEYDAFSLATKCLEDWEKFIKI